MPDKRSRDNKKVDAFLHPPPNSPPANDSADAMPPRTDTPADLTPGSVPTVNASRRSFLKGLATLTGGIAATGLLAAEQTPALAAGGSGGVPGSSKA